MRDKRVARCKYPLAVRRSFIIPLRKADALIFSRFDTRGANITNKTHHFNTLLNKSALFFKPILNSQVKSNYVFHLCDLRAIYSRVLTKQ